MCAVPEVWFDVKYWAVVVRCGMSSIAIAHYSPHHTISHQHLSQHTIPLCNNIFQIAAYRPQYASHHWRLALHPISYYWRTTWRHIPCTRRHISDHTLYWPHHLCTPPHLAPHFTQDIAPHSHAPHLTVITLIPHPTAVFHITFHITHQYTATFYIPPLVTSRITPPPLPRIAPCHSPHSHSTSHKAPHSMPQHTHQSILHHNFP